MTPATLSCAAGAQRHRRSRLGAGRAARAAANRCAGTELRSPETVEDPAAKLPASESPCFVITRLQLKRADGDKLTSIADFQGFLDAAAGPEHSDSPLGRCLGAGGVDTVLKRVQNAVMARGLVTTRVLAEPQDLTGGTLTLTVLAGRIHAIRFSEGSEARGNLWTAVPAQAGDLLNLRDIEQALENLKRVPTAEADIKIEGPARVEASASAALRIFSAFRLKRLLARGRRRCWHGVRTQRRGVMGAYE